MPSCSLTGPSRPCCRTTQTRRRLQPYRKQFMYGCSGTPTSAGMDGAQVNHDQGSFKPCADRNRRARPT